MYHGAHSHDVTLIVCVCGVCFVCVLVVVFSSIPSAILAVLFVIAFIILGCPVLCGAAAALPAIASGTSDAAVGSEFLFPPVLRLFFSLCPDTFLLTLLCCIASCSVAQRTALLLGAARLGLTTIPGSMTLTPLTTHKRTQTVSVCVCVCACVRACVCVCVRVCVCVCGWLAGWLAGRLSVRLCVCVCVLYGEQSFFLGGVAFPVDYILLMREMDSFAGGTQALLWRMQCTGVGSRLALWSRMQSTARRGAPAMSSTTQSMAR